MSQAAETLAPARPVRPFYWSVRRELWESPSLWIAPLAVLAVVLFAFLFSLPDLSRTIRLAEGDPAAIAHSQARAEKKVAATMAANGKVHGPTRVMTPSERRSSARSSIAIPYYAAAGALSMVSWLVAIFFCLNGLHGERRDRSILFWKSMPVSNLVTVGAKAFVPLVVQPIIILALAFGAHLVILIASLASLAAAGVGPERLMAWMDLPKLWLMMPYALLVNALWQLPLFGWLFLVSALAKRNAFAWAIVPWFALALFDWMVTRKTTVLEFIGARLFGGMYAAFGRPAAQTGMTQAHIDVGRLLVDPGLWGGLIVGAALFAACVWLRRTRDPL